MEIPEAVLSRADSDWQDTAQHWRVGSDRLGCQRRGSLPLAMLLFAPCEWQISETTFRVTASEPYVPPDRNGYCHHRDRP